MKNGVSNAMDPETYRKLPRDVVKIPAFTVAVIRASWAKVTGVFR